MSEIKVKHEWQKAVRERFTALSAVDLYEVLRHPLCVADESHRAWMRVCGEEICKNKIVALQELHDVLQGKTVSKSVVRRLKIMLDEGKGEL